MHKTFDSISPSAKSLLMMKGHTTIPFAKQAAALVGGGDDVFGLDFNAPDFWFWIRVMHFELRYRSIDQLLAETGPTNILELASGYSFRGLAGCRSRPELRYIDTDLEAVVAAKRELIAALAPDGVPDGLELQALNALDAAAFRAVVAGFPPGPLTIVNEGLLMYLNVDEKKQLCGNIRSILRERGGSWITADVYVRRSEEMQAGLPQSAAEREFSSLHQIEENKFGSYEEARSFFETEGFRVVKEAVPDYAGLSVLPKLQEALPESIRGSAEPPPKIQATWLLRLAAQQDAPAAR